MAQSKPNTKPNSILQQIKKLKDEYTNKVAEISNAFMTVQNNLLAHINVGTTKINAIFYLLKTKLNITDEEIYMALARQSDITNKIIELNNKRSLDMVAKVSMYLAWGIQKGFDVTAEDLNAKKWLFSKQSSHLSKEERLKLASDWGFHKDIGYFFEEEIKKPKKPKK